MSSSSSSAYKAAIKQLMARIQSNANDIGSIVRCVHRPDRFEHRSSFFLESIEYDHRTVPAKLPSQWSVCWMPSVSGSNRQTTGRSLSFDQWFSSIDHSVVEIQTRRRKEEQGLFRGEVETSLVSRCGYSIVPSAHQSQSKRFPSLWTLWIPQCQVNDRDRGRKVRLDGSVLSRSIKSSQMIDERRALVRSLHEQYFGDGTNHFLCARILLEQIKLDLASGNPLDAYVDSLSWVFRWQLSFSPTVINPIT